MTHSADGPKRFGPGVGLTVGALLAAAGAAAVWLAASAPTPETASPTPPSVPTAGAPLAAVAAPAQPTPTAAAPTWTVLVYGHGDHSLSVALARDMIEMQHAGSTDRFRIVVQSDFDTTQTEDLVEEGLPAAHVAGTTRWLMTSAADPKVSSQVLEKLPELDHDRPEVLLDFLRWGLKRFPADRVGVVLSDHGGQWLGYGGDEHDGGDAEPGSLTTAQLRDTLRTAMGEASVKQLAFLGFDTCLMGGAEVLGDFTDVTEVLIACPELDFGDGWEYGTTLGWLRDHPAATMAEFATHEVSAWRAHHMTPEHPEELALAAHAAYDMAKFGDFQRAFTAFSVELRKASQAGDLLVPMQRLRTTEYSIEALDGLAQPTDFVDVGHLAQMLTEQPAAPTALKAAASEVVRTVQALVLAKAMGSARSQGLGLSVWYPRDGRPEEEDGEEQPGEAESDTAQEDEGDEAGKAAATAHEEEGEEGSGRRLHGWPNYALRSRGEGETDAFSSYANLAFAKNTQWQQFLEQLHQNHLARPEPPRLAPLLDADVPLVATAAAPAQLDVQVTHGDGTFMVAASLVQADQGGDAALFTHLGSLATLAVSGPGNYQVRWNGQIPTLTDGRQRVPLGGAEMGEGKQLYVSYARYVAPRRAGSGGPGPASKGELVIVLSTFTAQGGQVLALLSAGANELAPTDFDPKPGGTLWPVYYTELRRDPDPSRWREGSRISAQGIVIPAGGLTALRVEMAPLASGSYHLELLAQDVDGDSSERVRRPVVVP